MYEKLKQLIKKIHEEKDMAYSLKLKSEQENDSLGTYLYIGKLQALSDLLIYCESELLNDSSAPIRPEDSEKKTD